MNKLFINRTLNLKKIKYIGLDMDQTLIKYKSEEFEHLAYKEMKQKLVSLLYYPKSILALKFDFKRAIRGLVIDKNRGHLMKVSRYGAVRKCYHGLEELDFKIMKRQFGTQFIDLNESSYDAVDTTFSISHCCLFAQIVDLKSKRLLPSIPGIPQISEDLQRVLNLSHSDGSIKEIVMKNLDKYIFRNKKLVENILRFKKHGKKFFIVTNSDFEYTNTLLTYAIDKFLPKSKKWTDLFTWTITQANKPRFFYDKLPILKVDPKTGMLKNHRGEVTEGVYQGGYSSHLTDYWNVTGDEILYVGDHIYGDILRLKKDCEWRTALVIEELEDEIKKNKKLLSVSKKIKYLMEQKIKIEKSINDFVAEAVENDLPLDENKKTQFKNNLKAIDLKVLPLLEKQKGFYNPFWGEVMRVGIEESHFANQVERFSDIYMTELNDLMSQNPRTYLRSRRRVLPHDLIETIEVE